MTLTLNQLKTALAHEHMHACLFDKYEYALPAHTEHSTLPPSLAQRSTAQQQMLQQTLLLAW